jgi:small subunit ribosomal protein S17
MADEKNPTEETEPLAPVTEVQETEVAAVASADDAAVAAEADADVEADVAADADVAVAEETSEAPVADATTTKVPPIKAPAAEAPIAPITKVTTPTERREARQATRLAEAGSRPTRTVEARQAERDELRKTKATARSLRRGQEREAYKSSEHERTLTPPREHVVGLKKTRQGIVTSDKAAKTITVRIDVARPHRKYKKIVRTSMTLHAHDEQNDAHIGDTVVVQEARPLSATKRWRLVQVVERAK